MYNVKSPMSCWSWRSWQFLVYWSLTLKQLHLVLFFFWRLSFVENKALLNRVIVEKLVMSKKIHRSWNSSLKWTSYWLAHHRSQIGSYNCLNCSMKVVYYIFTSTPGVVRTHFRTNPKILVFLRKSVFFHFVGPLETFFDPKHLDLL